VDQVNNALAQLDSGVQQDVSSSEGLASLSEELSAQARRLLDPLAFFKVDEGGARSPHAPGAEA
jgi:methyl-accepting chemotaxis protein